MLKFRDDEAWMRDKALAEDGCMVSVGGLITDLEERSMLKYRVLLIDTESNYRRPIQAYFNTMEQVDDWVEKILAATPGKGAWVEIYETSEREIGRINKKDLPLKSKQEMEGDDPLPVQGV